MTASPRSGRRTTWIGLALLLLVVAGVAVWWVWFRPRPEPDMVAVLHLHNRGVGHMERFRYEEAVAAFEEILRLAPDWRPGQINLGIALLNTATPANLERARALFAEVLRRQPDDPYAHYCLGVIFQHQGKPEEAAPHFKAVTRLDPDDPGGWYRLASVLTDDAERAHTCFARARQLDPYLSGAIYGLAMSVPNAEQRKKLVDELEDLRRAHWENPSRIRYGEMGRYAEVIGRAPEQFRPPRSGPLPLFLGHEGQRVQLAPGARWATAADLGVGPVAELRRRVRERFGGVQVVLDYNRDGRPDLLLLAAVVEAGRVRDLLLRNDGAGRFTDVTAEAGLGGARPSLGCCVADFDNNGTSDLFLTGAGEQRLFRNQGGRFEDVTAQAGLDQLRTVCLGAGFVDLDQDGDLDLVVAQYAATAEEALALLDGKGKAGAGLAVFLNVGEAPPAAPTEEPPPLKPRFRRVEGPAALLGEAVPAVGLAVGDFDLDRDLDLLVLADGTEPALVLNDRLLRFCRDAAAGKYGGPARWNGALVLDADRDGHSDLFFVGPGRRPLLRLAKPQAAEDTNAPPLIQAHAVDLDLDGATDVVGLSAQRRPVLLHNDGRRLVHAAEALGRDADWPRDLIAVAVADFDGDGLPDLLVWSEAQGVRLHANQGSGNHGLYLEPAGHRRVEGVGSIVRCNADGFGAWVSAQAGELWTGAEYTTLSAGLGQSRQPLLLGLGRHAQADVVRLRWPDNCAQAEFSVPAGRVVRIEETNRKGESCPVLFTWDGRRFTFVTDFLGAGSLGEMLPAGGYRTPRPEESVKIEPHQLAPRDGHFVLKVAEPMNELAYLDRLQLVVLDHPADVHVYPDERFVSSGPWASQELFAFRERVFPQTARDHRGRDVLPRLRAWDRDTVNGFARRSWLGFAEEHAVELDFGDRLARFGPLDGLVLCLAGWTDYPYPESIWAATQAGVALQPPVLERLGPDGRWHVLHADAGFPAGLPRMTTLEVTGQLGGPRCKLRLRTNMAVYWDQAFVAPVPEDAGLVRTVDLEVRDATLAERGCVQEHSPDGRLPTVYAYDRLEPVPVIRAAGRLTRVGDVTELLRETDDRFVVFGPGDEVTVRFDARPLPELRPGWTRSFVLRTWGYCKDSTPFTATAETVEPLPFRGMRTYPYGPDQEYPRDQLREEYRRRFNTRAAGPDSRK